MHHPTVEFEKTKSEAYDDYSIAVTATVNYEQKNTLIAKDPALQFEYSDTIIFEAMSGSGVTLGTAEGDFRTVRGGSVATVSTKISVSPEEIRKVAAVQARWKYRR